MKSQAIATALIAAESERERLLTEAMALRSAHAELEQCHQAVVGRLAELTTSSDLRQAELEARHHLIVAQLAECSNKRISAFHKIRRMADVLEMASLRIGDAGRCEDTAEKARIYETVRRSIAACQDSAK